MGKAIANEAGFPKNGTQREKANYVASRLPEAARTYSLKTGSGSVLSQWKVLIPRYLDALAKKLWGGGDRENAAELKSGGTGNCGEWSYAFSEMLASAGVESQVVFADKSPKPGSSWKFSGTDTAVLVEERDPSGRVFKRIYDPFRTGYSSKEKQPHASWLPVWTDVPLTEDDMTEAEKKALRKTWLKDLIKKKYLKSSGNQNLIEHEVTEEHKKPKCYLIGKVTHEEDGSPATEVTVTIRGEGFETSLAPQGDGDFTDVLKPGSYTVSITLPNGVPGPSAELTLKAGDKERLSFTVPKSVELPPYLGKWNGQARVVKSSSPEIVGRVQPFEMEIVPAENGVTVIIPTASEVKVPPQVTTNAGGNHVRLDYSGPAPWFPQNEVMTTKLVWWLDVTADKNRLTGELYSHAETTIHMPGIPTEPGKAEVLFSLDLQKQN